MLGLRNNQLKLRKSNNRFRGNLKNGPQFNVEKSKDVQHVNQLELGTLGSRPIMPKNLPSWAMLQMCPEGEEKLRSQEEAGVNNVSVHRTS